MLEIAICTYNRAGDLDRCLNAISRQECGGDWRVSVVDNASTDDTEDVVSRHAGAGRLPELRRLHERRMGLTFARQRAVAESRADWVAFVDDDCRLRPGWVDAALAAAAGHPDAGALGGRVLPDYGRAAPSYLRRHGWLFAEQDHGPQAHPVDSLVGTGLVLNRSALAATGWVEAPLLADRIGRGFVSGGDVEISARLRAAGRELRFEPGMALDHVIAPERQRPAGVARLAAGLGGGSVLAGLLDAPDMRMWLTAQSADVRAARRRHRIALASVARGRYSLADWFVHDAFLRGRARQLATVAKSPDDFAGLAGACRRAG